jgi:1-acyl-sn-glycerol-3-phosphate acyltransferase
MPDEVKKLKAPYLVLTNHVGFWDPFVAGHFLPHFTHFVSSDAVFRNPLLRFFLTRLGTIPKKKNIRDSQVIRDIVGVIRQGENVGIFPEAVRNWSGASSPMDPSIGKLIKMLKVPVVVPILKGMNLMHPRWSFKLRPYPMEVEYKLLFTEEDVAKLDSQSLFEGLSKGMKHDEVDYQRQRMQKINYSKRAEHISHALYLCPECQAIDSFRAHKNDFTCEKCNYSIHIDEYGFFERNDEGKLHFDNIRDWFNWEEKAFVQYVREMYHKNDQQAILTDKKMEVFKNESSGKLGSIGLADILLYPNKIIVDFYEREALVFNFNDLKTINPQTQERLEIFYGDDAYRIVGTRPGVSALKWEVAANVIWKEMGLDAKRVPYIRA